MGAQRGLVARWRDLISNRELDGGTDFATLSTMEDLQIPAGPGVPNGLLVPAGDLKEQFTHSSGPGGQGVNTTDSRVQLSIDLATTTALSDTQRQKVLQRLSHRLSGTTLTIAASSHRSQLRNRRAARERLGSLLREALAPKRIRRPTKPTRGSQRRRLEAKRHRAKIKENRKRPLANDIRKRL